MERGVWMPRLAGLFHLVVFSQALAANPFFFTLDAGGDDGAAFFAWVARAGAGRTGHGGERAWSGILWPDLRIEGAVVVAYVFDLVCCVAGVVPFSRCRRPGEILGHHLPVLCVFVPLALPFYLGSKWEPSYETWRADPRNVEAIIYQTNSWAFVSSLNEFIMCNARAEMEAGRSKGFWNSKPMAYFELVYKLGIFVVFSSFSIWSACTFDLMRFREARLASATLVGAIVRTYASPVQLRTLLWRVFIVTKYPSMARRTLGKLRKLIVTGSEDGATASERANAEAAAAAEAVAAPAVRARAAQPASVRAGRKTR